MQSKVTIRKPSSFLVKLLFAIVVKQCITMPVNQDFLKLCDDPAIKEVLLKLFQFNQTLSEMTDSSYLSHYDLNLVLTQYGTYLQKLGFTREQQLELFPANMLHRKMLSLQDQAILKLRESQSQDKQLQVLKIQAQLLSQELRELIFNEDYIFGLFKQNYINQKLGERRIPSCLDSNASNKLKNIFNNPIDFSAYGKLETEINSIEKISFLLKLFSIPENHWPTTFDEKTGYNVYHIAAAFGPMTIFEELVTIVKFDEILCSRFQTNALHLAIISGNDLVAKFLIDRHKHESRMINAVTDRKKAPLHFAAFYHNPELVRLLVESGANLDLQDIEGNTPLHLANNLNDRSVSTPKAYNEYLMVTEYLLGQNANSELLNVEGLTAYESFLSSSAFWCDSKIFKEYYKKKADGNIFLYAEQLEAKDAIHSLMDALRQSRGVVFFGEFAKKYPNKILEFRDDLKNNIIHVINFARRQYHQRNVLHEKLLKIVSENFSILYRQKNSQGHDALAILDHGVSDPDRQHIFDHNDYLYRNTSLSERYPCTVTFGIIPLVLGLLVLITTLSIAKKNQFNVLTVGLPTAMLIGGLLLTTYMLTPTHYLYSFKDWIVTTLSCQPRGSRYELRQIIIENPPETEEIEPIVTHPSPIGVNFRKLESREPVTDTFQSQLIALYSYINRAKEKSDDLKEALVLESFLDKLNPILDNHCNYDNAVSAQEIVDYFEEQLELGENQSFIKESFKNNLNIYLREIREFCLETRSVNNGSYGTFSS